MKDKSVVIKQSADHLTISFRPLLQEITFHSNRKETANMLRKLNGKQKSAMKERVPAAF